MRLLISVTCVFLLVHFAYCDPIRNSNMQNDIYTVEAISNSSICKQDDAKMWSHNFHSCFIDRKYADGGRDLNNIVDRILVHSKDCIKNVRKECRPDYEGFIVIMKKVIGEMKDYSFIYLESIVHDRDKVKDLECVENILSLETYKSCFKVVLQKEYSQEEFPKEVENALLCTNQANQKCSKAAKTSLNRMLRNILGVKQPTTENIEDDPKPEPPKNWYDYMFQPFISAWNAVRNFLGF